MKPIQLLAVVATLGSVLVANAEVPTTITYQGRVQVSGANFSGTGQFKFALVDAGSASFWSNDGSSAAGSEPSTAVSLPVAQGLFTAPLGDATLANMTPIPPDVLTNRDVRLRIWFNDGANGFAALSPDQPLTSAPYALHALNAGAVTGPVPASLLTGTIAPANLADGGIEASKLASNSVTSVKIADGTIQLSDLSSSVSNGFWKLGGNNGTIPGTNFIGTTDNRPLEFRANGQTALRVLPNGAAPSLVGGFMGNEVVGNLPGVVIAGGGQASDTNRVSAAFSVISGGKGHTVAADYGVVGGGFRHAIEPGALFATISGGRSHNVQSNALDATIGGGQNNRVGTNAAGSTIAGGLANTIFNDAQRATIGGGYFNSARSPYAVIGGGTENQATNAYALVAGGYQNRANGEAAVVGGGQANRAEGGYATVGGGFFNAVLRDEAVVAGGSQNGATNYSSTVAGGRLNLAGGISSSVGGGERNTAGGDRSVVGGGSDNEATGTLSVVPGGANNSATAPYTFAAGRSAKANHEGSFVWADTQLVDFASTANKQFSVRAAGGVRFETGGAGVTVDGQPAIAGQVTAAQIADGAVTAAKLVSQPVLSTPLALTNPTPEIGDQFGDRLVAVGNNRAVVSAWSDNTGANNAGAVHVFDLNGTLLTTITNPQPADGDQFGQSLAAVGNDKILVGSALNDAGGFDGGSAYLFTLDGTLLTTLVNPTPADFDAFGFAVAGVGTTRVAVSARGDDSYATNAGAVYLFNLSGFLLTTITNPAAGNGDQFGSAITAVGTDKLLVGASSAKSGAAAAGAAYLFDLNGNLLTTFTNPTPANTDLFGDTLAAVGSDKVLIGAYRDSLGAANAGVAYLFDLSGTLLTTFTNPTPTTFELFGGSVAALGTDKVLIGARNDTVTGTSAGAVYCFDLSGRLLATLTNTVPEAGSSFGAALATAGSETILVGAPLDNTGVSDAGAAYVFSVSQYTPGLFSEGVRAGSITTASLAENIITSGKILDGAITSTDIADGSITVEKLAPATLNNTFWKLNGNSGTTAGTDFVGTTDTQPLELKVNNARALRIEPNGTAPNLIGGYSGNNAAGGVVAVVIGGGGNSASPNSIQANYSTIVGGIGNGIESGSLYASIGGGNRNLVRIDSQSATIAGGRENTIHTNSDYAFIGGGYQNSIQSDSPYATLAGGYTNQIMSGARYATLAGGTANTNGGHYSSISGGWQNDVRSNAQSSVVAGGYRNVISNNSSYCLIAGGAENRIDGGQWYSTIAGGFSNRASGYYSFAAGQQARARDYGSFVWSDGSIGAVSSFGANTFAARAAGGARFYTIADLSVGVNLPAGGGAWAPISDRAVKDNVRPVDGRDVLEKVAALSLNTWNYKSQDASIRHIGPMAQDFHAVFGVGEDERHITTVDADGVALAAIQGLNKKLEQELRARDAEIGELKRAVSEMKQLIRGLPAQKREGQ